MSIYGCGPAAGTNLLYSLAKRNYSFDDILWWTSDPNRAIDPSTMGSLLATNMSAIAGTTFIEFKTGLTSYLNNYNHYNSLSSELRSDTSDFSGATTTSNYVVWQNIKYGIDGNKPVAIIAGSKTSTGSSNYPDTYPTSQMAYHWFTGLGYIEDSDYNMYLKVSSWGDIYYISYNALCYWRNALGSVYIIANYN